MGNEFRDIRRQIEDAYKKEQTQKSLQERQQREAQQRREEEKRQFHAQALQRIEEACNLGLRLGIRGILENIRREVWKGKGEICEGELVYPDDYGINEPPYRYWEYEQSLQNLYSKKFTHIDTRLGIGHVLETVGSHTTWGIVIDQILIKFSGQTQRPFSEGRLHISDHRSHCADSLKNINERWVRKRQQDPFYGLPYYSSQPSFGNEQLLIGDATQAQIRDILRASCLARGYDNLPK